MLWHWPDPDIAAKSRRLGVGGAEGLLRQLDGGTGVRGRGTTDPLAGKNAPSGGSPGVEIELGAGELAFETARRFGVGFAFRDLLFEVGGRTDVHAFTERASRDRQRVEIRLARLAHAASRPAGARCQTKHVAGPHSPGQPAQDLTEQRGRSRSRR